MDLLSVLILVAAVLIGIVWMSSRGKASPSSHSPYVPDSSYDRRSTRQREPEPVVYTRLQDVVSPAQYAMEYGDTDGVVSIRAFDVIDLEEERSNIYIRAHCHLRRGERTFRVDRILALRDLKNNVLIDDPETYFYAQIPGHEPFDREHEAVMHRAISGLHPLLWIAMADKEISSDEREILLEFIEKRNVLSNKKFADIPWSRSKASAMLDRGRTNISTANEALEKMTFNGREYNLVKAYAEKLAAVGGKASERRKNQLFGAT